MATTVQATDDPQQVLDEAGEFLASDPVRHNVILTLLHARIAHPEDGRYWMANADGRTVGVVFQSPVHFTATVTPMPSDAVIAVVDAIADQGVHLPGVSGEAATAARFAGHWTERRKVGALPARGERIYEVDGVVTDARASGGLRSPVNDDRDFLVGSFEDFQAEIGESAVGVEFMVDRRLDAGQLWIWDDHGPVATAGLSAPVAGVVRVGPVYTPPEARNRGYASALVAAISRATRAAGHRCILYTDLANPTSNSIYRAIGYRAVAEALKYDFD
jgi:Predicted acetyltransferase